MVWKGNGTTANVITGERRAVNQRIAGSSCVLRHRGVDDCAVAAAMVVAKSKEIPEDALTVKGEEINNYIPSVFNYRAMPDSKVAIY